MQDQDKSSGTLWRTSIAKLIAWLLAMALLLFVPAGRVDWLSGWLFYGAFVVLLAAAAIYLWRVNPEIFAARSRIQKGTKRWDKIILAFLLPLFALILPVAGLDAGRFGWSHMPWWLVAVGYALLAAGIVITAWAEGVNKFFEPGVRIQSERGHRVIDSGPYAIIRHPGYFAALLMLPGMALSLGSWWALVPAAAAAILLIVRTVLEDRMLQAELPGYAQYARRVRYRLLPGMW